MPFLDTEDVLDPTLLSLEDDNSDSEAGGQNPRDDSTDDGHFTSGSESAYEDDRPVTKSKKGTRREVQTRGKKKAKEGGDEEEDEEDDDVFDRLAGYVGRVPRGGSVVPTGGVLNPGNDNNGDEDMEQPVRPRKRRRARPAHKPTHEVSVLLSKSNLDYIQGNSQQAIQGFLEVIRLDPYIYGSWSSLGTLYEAEGNIEAAQQMKFCALHIEGDADGWRDLAMEFKGTGRAEECIYCLRKSLAMEPQDVLALWEISAQYKATGKMARALESLRKLLRHEPDMAHDFSILADLHQIALETKQYRFGADALRTAFDWHLETFSGPEDSRSGETNTMTLKDVINLSDLLLQLDELEEAVVIIRRGQRWLQGRKSQRHWDLLEDDREYDSGGVVREGDKAVEDDDEVETYPLDVNLRQRLALVRLKLGHDVEARIHTDELLNLEAEQYQTMFEDLGKALMAREEWEKALDCFAKLQECEAIDDAPETIMAIGICQHHMKDNAAAMEALRWVVSVRPDNLDARLKLASVLEELGQKSEALEIVSEVLRIRALESHTTRGRGPTEKPRQSKADKNVTQKLNKRVLENQMRQKMQEFWEEVQMAEAGIMNGDFGSLDRFVAAAGTMIENFRLAKANFSKNRGVSRVAKPKKSQKKDVGGEAEEMQDRLERTLGFEDEAPMEDAEKEDEEVDYRVVRQTHFYGLGCEEWLTLIVKYCCVLMVKDEEELAMEILEHVCWAGLFNNTRSEVALRLTIIACAMRTKSYLTIVENSRRLGQLSQFRTEPHMLMLACMGGGGMAAHAAWQNGTYQKFIHRELRMYDYLVKGYKFHYSISAKRWAQEGKTGMSHNLGDAVPVNEEDDNDDEEDGETGDGEDEEEAGSEAKKPVKIKRVIAWQRNRRIMIEQPVSEGDEDMEDGTEGGGIMDQDDDDDNDNDPALLDIPVRPTKGSPQWNWLYGVWMLNGKSYQTAIFYLLRAYEYDEYNTLLCLCLAQAYFGRAMVRQADNRNYFIAQGLAFLARYRKLSDTDDPIMAEEVEYNFARAFHGIGVIHLAVKHYELVLNSVEQRMMDYEEQEDRDTIRSSSLALEAAHNLMLIYATNGSMPLVKEKSKWLAI